LCNYTNTMVVPVQTSAVYLLGPGAQYPAIPPPSPPSPVTPEASVPCTPLEELSLDSLELDSGDEATSTNFTFPSSVSSASIDHAPTTLDDRLSAAVHVLSTEAATLSALSRLYTLDFAAREAFSRAVSTITRASHILPGHNLGKLVMIGVGKSGHIAKKLVATFNSLSVPATFLHPTEALHGDLGVINRSVDTLMLITFSGNTPELTSLLPHLDPGLPLVLLTGAKNHGKSCAVVRMRPDAIVIPAPIHELEIVSFGVAAPTTSTTAALAMGDALALVCAQELHATMGKGKKVVAGVFARNHPGGAIGAANSTASTSSSPQTTASNHRRARPGLSGGSTTSMREIATSWKEIPLAAPESQPQRTPQTSHASQLPPPLLTAADILRAGYTSPSGWVRTSSGVISPSRIKSLPNSHLSKPLDEIPGLVTGRFDFICVAADTTVSRAADWVREMMTREEDELCRMHSIVGVLQDGQCVGVLEVGELLERTGQSGS
jgi:D-arabinose 5-phosphate isomerase GutQ